ncbi:MAG: alpha/beta hydrolase [bacterium]|nr:alpha/beta hydrolase [bacterium]
MSHQRIKLEFTSNNIPLAGLLEIPSHETHAYVLFAHCFTCGKDTAAASRIARGLVNRGCGVLRFDFTGLGNSDGDFSNTNFSSNVQDLIAAADYLRAHYQAPALLLGHSLGGTAVLKAAHEIPECVGVVSIGSPADANHVAKHFACDLETIQRDGKATVNLAGRTFSITKQFLDDIARQDAGHIGHLRKALLVMHSPVDTIVSIQEAEKIYRTAKHPKSFISLDAADHLLTKAEDAEYAAACISAWASKFLPV